MYLRIAYCVSDAYIPRMFILINSKYCGCVCENSHLLFKCYRQNQMHDLKITRVTCYP